MVPDDLQSRIAEAREAVEQGDHVRALAIADQLVARQPREVVARALRAEVLLKADLAEEAFQEARQAVALDPQDCNAQTLLGMAAWRSARLTLAQQSLERAIALSDNRPGLLVDYAWFMAAERGPRLAEEAARRALAATENSSTAWAALGLALFRLHRRQEAEACLRRALELDPNDPYAQSVMVKLLHEQRQDNKAVALTTLLEDTPGTEPIVQEIRKQAKQRLVAMKLLQRKALPPTRDEEPRRVYRWLIIASLLSTALTLWFQPTTPLPFFVCVFLPILVVWPFRRLFG
jgi:Tfp pilus assembly protein PilF